MRDLIKVGCLALVLSWSLAAPVAAGPIEDAMAAEARGDYATALRLLRPPAEQGDARAQSSLGLIYATGLGVPQDYTEAVRWYRKAADQGNAFAQSALGGMYFLGSGVPQDYATAMTWFRKAADHGDVTALLSLGAMCENGFGTLQDYVEAHKWYNLAAHFPSSTTTERGTAIKSLDAVAAKMTAAQIAEAHRLAREWKPK